MGFKFNNSINIMAVKETYKPKEENIKKLQIFLNKLDKKNDTNN